jgi:hypothetical protein
MNIDELQQRSNDYHDTLLERKRKRYQYARNKGFNPEQSRILSSTTEEDIDRLAKERDEKAGA